MLRPLFEKPLGAIIDIGSVEIDNCHTGTTRAVTCEICGTNHGELEECGTEQYHLATFLGRQVVIHCCGKIFNIAYQEFGKIFAIAKLIEFSKNPADDAFFLSHISSCLNDAEKNLLQALKTVNAACNNLKSIT